MSDQPTSSQGSLAGLIFKNAAFVTVGMVLLKVANFIFHVYVVRRLGDNRMGQYATALAFVGIFQILAELGITQFVSREIARDREKIHTYFWNLVVVRALLALLNMAFIPILGSLFGYSGDVLLGIAVYTASFLLAALSFPLTMVLTAREKLGHVTIVNVASQVTFILLGSVFLLSGLGFIWLIVANLAGLLIQSLLAFLFIRRLEITGFGFHLEPSTWLPMIRAGLPFGIISLMLSIAFSIDTVMLSKFVADNEVGWYGVAYNLVFSLMIFMGGFSQAIVPSLSRVFVHDAEEIKRWYQATVKFILLISLPIAVGGFLLAYPIFSFLYTDEFLPSALAFQILVWDVPLLMYAAFAGDMTTITDQERAAARIYTINTVANVVINLILIPKFGMIGAALVTVLTDLISAIQFYLLFRQKLALPSIRSLAMRIAGAALLMGGAVWLLRSYHFGLAIVAGMLVYFILSVLLGVIGKTEFALVRRVIGKLHVRQAGSHVE